MLLALFAVAPITCSALVSLLYSLYLFMAYEESGFHHAQEFENRFWTIFAILLTTALLFAEDSPLAFGRWNPTLGWMLVLLAGYVMHLWDRYMHRQAISQQTNLRRSSTAGTSLLRLREMGIPVEEQLFRINECLRDIDQLLIPSTVNNFINQRFILSKEREIVTIFEECDARALNYLISHVKLGLLFYKIKDHRSFHGKHRTELINLLAVERLSILTVISRVIVLHSLQLLKLRANPRAEGWVRNIILNTFGDDLSELKTLTDAKGDYFCMNKLIYDDIRSEGVRQDILNHIRREAAVQQTKRQMGTSKRRIQTQWRKVLSDVDDTLFSSGGMYPAGVDKRYPKKVVYPGVLAFYRELDLGTDGPEEWQEDRVGNLVFLSARPHVYKDMSEKANFAKFEKLRVPGEDGRKGMHTVPSLLSGDLASGSSYIVMNDMEPLARKKFDNFRRYVSIYPEYQHTFVCDNGQGDVRAGEMMFDSFPYEFEALYVHMVMDIPKTFGYDPERWRQKEFKPIFFRTYPEAALHAASRDPPFIRVNGLQRICYDAVQDFVQIKPWPSEIMKAERRMELNQAIWRANQFLTNHGVEPVELILAERRWSDGEKVRTPYGIGCVKGFDPRFDMYELELDWRPIDIQVAEYTKEKTIRSKTPVLSSQRSKTALETVVESDEGEDDTAQSDASRASGRSYIQTVGEPSAEVPLIGDTDKIKSSPDNLVEASCLRNLSERSLSVSSISTISDSGDSTEEKSDPTHFRVSAIVSGRLISKYTPPILPKLDKKASLFTFLNAAPEAPKPLPFNEGDKCNTPYGPARVKDYREKQGIVVVEMAGWKATGYLRTGTVKVIPKSLFSSLLGPFGSGEVQVQQKPLEFPYATGTQVPTPFGQGTVVRPLSFNKSRFDRRAPTTIGISLDNWRLSDGSHPILFCTVDSALKWREGKADEGASFLSTLGSLVSSSFGNLVKPKPTPKIPQHKQFYKEAASVSTRYGDGVVLGFRESDGFYQISLVRWKLANGKQPVAYIRREGIGTRVARNCQEGYPVLTSLGLSGILASVEPTTGVHIVTIPSAGMVCYLQPEAIVRPLKAAVGEDVLTPYGEGKVTGYNIKSDVYTIKLPANLTLYAKAATFDRLGDGVQDRDGPFGVNWLLGFLFYNAKSQQTRSRSNSLVSSSNRST